MKKRVIIIIVSIIICLAIPLLIWGNIALELNKYTIESNKLPKDFNGFKIAHLSDFHNTEMGENNKNLLNILEDASPDIIVITGDLIDIKTEDYTITIDFIKNAMKIAPCYYVTGNHESYQIGHLYEPLEKELLKLGVIVLHNKEIIIERGNSFISLAGIDDVDFDSTGIEQIGQLYSEDSFKILLSHRPELFEQYVSAEVDLVFSGHAHGGQFRLPLVGGLVAPNQGLFPKYDSGIFTQKNTSMLVSRGIGNSSFPIRLNNRPEVILVELNSVE